MWLKNKSAARLGWPEPYRLRGDQGGQTATVAQAIFILSKRSINRVPCAASSEVTGVGGWAALSYSDVSAMFQVSSAS